MTRHLENKLPPHNDDVERVRIQEEARLRMDPQSLIRRLALKLGASQP